MLLGQYLLKAGALTPEDLLGALDEQRLRVEQFGRIAIRNGYLSASRLLQLLDDQVLTTQRVGELAIGRGYMTYSLVLEVLREQKSQHRPIGALLVERGALNPFQLKKHLSDYFALTSEPPATERSSSTLPIHPSIREPSEPAMRKI